MKKIVLGITDCSKYASYEAWFSKVPDLEIIKLSYHLNNAKEVERCHAIVYTGGEDMHPRYYNQPELLPYCHLYDMDEQRDEFELGLLKYTDKHEIPTLGVCRGMQLYNVFKGGTLIPDIPSWGKFNHFKFPDNTDRVHSVLVDVNSDLYNAIGMVNGEVNSNHHQSIDRVGEGLVACVLSPDGVIEAIERKEPQGKGFLCLIQWHPERMKDQDSPFVYTFKDKFIKAARAFAEKN